jgi:hypothetical protein
MRIVPSLACVLLLSACQGKSPEPAPTPTKPIAAKEVKPATEPADAKRVEAKAPTPAEPSADAKAPPDDPRGARFVDPPWFRKELFPDATSANVSRTQRNEQGLFSSQILFDLPAGTTADACVKTLREAVQKEVPDLQESPDAKLPGRLQLSGKTDRYSVMMICGDAKGTMRAFVSFEWTSP